MQPFQQDEFNQFILDNGVYGFFEKPITLKSGRTSHFYANWRTVVEDVWLTERLVDFVIRFVASQGLEVDTFFGVPEGATKLGVLTQYTWARRRPGYCRGSHALAMGRAKPKEHGAARDRYFVGTPRGRILLLEDVTTTGGSSLAMLAGLQEAGLEVIGLLSLTNRMETRDDGRSVREAVEEQGVAFFNMSTALELLPAAYRQLQPGADIARAIEVEFRRYGVEPLRLL
jgi:orotate phosphoribosyltransferase